MGTGRCFCGGRDHIIRGKPWWRSAETAPTIGSLGAVGTVGWAMWTHLGTTSRNVDKIIGGSSISGSHENLNMQEL